MNQEKYNLSFGGGLLMLGDLQDTAAELMAADKKKPCLDEKEREDLNAIMVESNRAAKAIRTLFSQINGFHTPSHMRLQEIYHKMVAANHPPESGGDKKDAKPVPGESKTSSPASATPPVASTQSPFSTAAGKKPEGGGKGGGSKKPTSH